MPVTRSTTGRNRPATSSATLAVESAGPQEDVTVDLPSQSVLGDNQQSPGDTKPPVPTGSGMFDPVSSAAGASVTTHTIATPTTGTTTADTIQRGLLPLAAPTSKSVSRAPTASSTRSKRASLFAEARTKIARLRLEVAEAELAELEAHEIDEEDSNVDDVSIAESQARVQDWVETNQRHRLAIDNQPQQDTDLAGEARSQDLGALPPPAYPAPSVTPAIAVPLPQQGTDHRDRQRPRENERSHYAHQLPLSRFAPIERSPYAPQHLSNFAPTSELNEPSSHAPPPLSHFPQPAPPAGVAAQTGAQIDLSQLAAAITLAAREGRAHREIELPVFAGAHQEWISFRNAYRESAMGFTEVENVARLRKSLKGRAKEAVESLLESGVPTDEILHRLESRFGRPDAIAQVQIDRLRALPRLTDAPRDIGIFSNRVSNIVTTLRSLDCVAYLLTPELMMGIIEKMTPPQRYRWFDYAAEQSQKPDLVLLEQFLRREADRCAPFAQPEVISDGVTSQYRPAHRINTAREIALCCSCDQRRRPAPVYGATELKHAALKKKAPLSLCSLCGDNHRIISCTKFMALDVNNRWNAAKKHRLCFNCLQLRTRTHHCERERCGVDGCPRSHNRLLHVVSRKQQKEAQQKKRTVASTWTPRESQNNLKDNSVCISKPAGEMFVQQQRVHRVNNLTVMENRKENTRARHERTRRRVWKSRRKRALPTSATLGFSTGGSPTVTGDDVRTETGRHHPERSCYRYRRRRTSRQREVHHIDESATMCGGRMYGT